MSNSELPPLGRQLFPLRSSAAANDVTLRDLYVSASISGNSMAAELGRYLNFNESTFSNSSKEISTSNDAVAASGSSSSIAQTVNVTPVSMSANSTSVMVGHRFSFAVTVTGLPTAKFSISGHLPSGVSFNNATGVLSETPAHGTAGTYTFTISATNAAGTTTQSFTLTVTT